MTRKSHDHTQQTNQWHHEGKAHINNRRIAASGQLWY